MGGENRSSGSGGIGFFGLLTVAFIVLKLTGTVAWSWWLVLAPIYAPVLLVLVLAAMLYIAAAAVEAFERRGRK